MVAACGHPTSLTSLLEDTPQGAALAAPCLPLLCAREARSRSVGSSYLVAWGLTAVALRVTCDVRPHVGAACAPSSV